MFHIPTLLVGFGLGFAGSRPFEHPQASRALPARAAHTVTHTIGVPCLSIGVGVRSAGKNTLDGIELGPTVGVEQDTNVVTMAAQGQNTGGGTSDEGTNKRNGRNRRRRNRNRGGNTNKSKSRSPSTDQKAKSNANQRTPNKSRSPACYGNKSASPTRRNDKSKSPNRQRFRNTKKQHPGMTVIVNQFDLWDSAAHYQPDEAHRHIHQLANVHVSPFRYDPTSPGTQSIAVARVPHCIQKLTFLPNADPDNEHSCDVIDTKTPNPHDPSVVHDKYWCQRRRLFSKFDMGIELDAEGWFSVTPEIIADHVAQRVAELAKPIVEARNDGRGIVLMDAFCGCGGNSIAFGKIDPSLVGKVVCVDTDRSKLLKAAHNAALYGIPTHKIVFIECNSTFILRDCYKNGRSLISDIKTYPMNMPEPVGMTQEGYEIGGPELLPHNIDVVFMDPPWGGVDYEVLGKNGYDLKKNMKIRVSPEEAYEGDGDGVGDDFFDMFSTPTSNKKMSQSQRQANFNKKTDGEFIDGMEMLKIAAEATSSHIVIYDLPRNTNKTSLGQCASAAGFRGNIKLEEHYLNGRLKTVTAYMGADYSNLINSLQEPTSSLADGEE
eukprot:scaffold5067_cov139-Cylindrotheca_fusiformis.AAC.5